MKNKKLNVLSSWDSYRAVLFDFEGTLVDFQWKTDEAVKEALAALGTLGFDEDQFRRYDYATLFNKAMEGSEELKISPEKVREKMGELYDHFDMDAVQRWAPKDDAKYVLENLIKGGVSTGLVTNAGQKAISLTLRRFHLERLFNVVITRNNVKRLKPHGESILKAIDVLQLGKREILFVGDSVTDIRATLQVGIDMAIVLGGESKRRDIERYRPRFVLRSLSEVLRIV